MRMRCSQSMRTGWISLSLITHPSRRENVDDILKEEVGKIFARVLEDAGVYKCTPEGREAFGRFLASVGFEKNEKI